MSNKDDKELPMKETTIRLPAPQLSGKVSLEETIAQRRSVRRYLKEPLDLFKLSQILWAAQGITHPRGLRAAPSAGATYPLEIFVVSGDGSVKELPAGSYQYLVDSHSLELHRAGDFRPDLARAALRQNFIVEAPLDIVICAVYRRTCDTYGKRGERYIHMEVGHVGENIHLQVVALGLASVEVGAFRDDEVSKVLCLDETVKPLYIMPVGKSAH